MRRFEFDCGSFAPSAPSACTPIPGPEQTLLDVVNSYRVSARSCGTWPVGSAGSPENALAGLDSLDRSTLTALDKALIQNAILELASCGNAPGPGQKTLSYVKRARALLPKFALSADEVATLPTSDAVLGPWLGDPGAWFDGHVHEHFHDRSDGFTRAHRQLMKQNTLADVVRLVLVDAAGAPFVSDVVERVVFRRMDPDGAVHTCFAELASPASRCDPVGLHPLAEERGKAVLGGYQFTSVPCNGCHTANLARANPYGPSTGFAVDDETVARIKTELKPLLGH